MAFVVAPSQLSLVAGWQKLAAFRRMQKWPQTFRQARICYFRDKFVVFAFSNVIFIPQDTWSIMNIPQPPHKNHLTMENSWTFDTLRGLHPIPGTTVNEGKARGQICPSPPKSQKGIRYAGWKRVNQVMSMITALMTTMILTDDDFKSQTCGKESTRVTPNLLVKLKLFFHKTW